MARTGIQFIGTSVGKKWRELGRQVRGQVDAAVFAVAVDTRGDFEKTVATWKEKPKFEIVKRARSYTVRTDSEIYRFVDKGTRAHQIAPRNKPFLAFQGGYQAKTAPRVIASRPGGPRGPVVFTQKPVQHPGTKARRFSEVIFAKWQKKVGPAVRTALKRGVEAVGL